MSALPWKQERQTEASPGTESEEQGSRKGGSRFLSQGLTQTPPSPDSHLPSRRSHQQKEREQNWGGFVSIVSLQVRSRGSGTHSPPEHPLLLGTRVGLRKCARATTTRMGRPPTWGESVIGSLGSQKTTQNPSYRGKKKIKQKTKARIQKP